LLLIPAAAFVPSARDAIRLLRTDDLGEASRLWRRSLLLAVIGMALTVASAISVERITPV
jgi:hypothetical protein